MKNIKSKLFGFVAAVVVALSLPATGHSQILYNGYFNIDWQYNWPLGDSYADKSSGWGMNFEGGYYFPSNVGLGAFIAFHTNNKYIPRQTFPIGGTGAITTDQQHSVFQLPFGVTGRYRFTQGRVLEPYVAVKVPVFSFEKLANVDTHLGPEMKSTGECLGIAKTFNEALYKAFQGAGIKLPKYKNMIITVRDSDKEEMVDIAARFKAQGYRIFCTNGTARYLYQKGVVTIPVRKIEQESPNILDLILGHEIDLVIDIPAQGAERSHDGFIIRRNAIETGVTVLTAIDTARALVTSMENRAQELTLINIADI